MLTIRQVDILGLGRLSRLARVVGGGSSTEKVKSCPSPRYPRRAHNRMMINPGSTGCRVISDDEAIF
jgi:hypothetical protein